MEAGLAPVAQVAGAVGRAQERVDLVAAEPAAVEVRAAEVQVVEEVGEEQDLEVPAVAAVAEEAGEEQDLAVPAVAEEWADPVEELAPAVAPAAAAEERNRENG